MTLREAAFAALVAACLVEGLVIENLRTEVANVRAAEKEASDAWDKCAGESDHEREVWRDEGLARMVREEVEVVFWPCGRAPLPDGYCEALEAEEKEAWDRLDKTLTEQLEEETP